MNKPKYVEYGPKHAEAARANVEAHLGDVAGDYEDDEEALAAALYDEAYTLAHDGAVSAGATHEEARAAAEYVARCYAQP